MFKKKNNKKGINHRKIFWTRTFSNFIRFIRRYTFLQFVINAVIIAAAVIGTFEGFEYIYKQSVITRQTAVVQNEAVLIAAEYSGYAGLHEADMAGMNDRLNSYSAMNQIRIRVIDLNYNVYADTYSTDTGKTIINSRVFDIFTSHKTNSVYDKKSGDIQAVTPVYNENGDFIAVLLADLDYTEIDSLFVNVNSQNNNIKVIIITICFVALLVSSRFLNKPVRRLTDIVANVNAGHTDERIPMKGYTEIREIAEDFNGIMDKANETDQSRAEFVSNVSHELKTPIALIQGYAEGLKEGITDDPESMEFYCDVIMDEANKMNIMVKRLLTLNQIEFGNDEPEMERFNINELMASVVDANAIRAGQKNMSIVFDNRNEQNFVWADEYKTEEVLTNYISNALNHCDGKRAIEVRTGKSEDGGTITVTVYNSGKNIADEDLERIWEKFYKTDKARTREYGGNGIGLSIVKAIMDSMGQEYGVRNVSDGVEFWFNLDCKS